MGRELLLATPVQSAADIHLLEKMAETWLNRATVRADLVRLPAEYADPSRPDYPSAMIPFLRHPLYERVAPETARRVETWAWLVFNDRSIQAEEYLANPAFTLIMHGAFEGADDIALKRNIQQCLIDEHFHTYVHMMAMHETRRFRRLHDPFAMPVSLAARRLREMQAQTSDPWERNCLALVFATVTEVSIKAYLSLIADDQEIQPLHSAVALVHNRDESAHGQILVPVVRILWAQMNERQRRFFTSSLPAALESFTAHDFSAWRAILEHEQVKGATEIVADCERQAREARVLVRDVSGIRRLVEQLGVLDQVEFDFPS